MTTVTTLPGPPGACTERAAVCAALARVGRDAGTIIHRNDPRLYIIPPHREAVKEVISWAAARSDLLTAPTLIVADEGVKALAEKQGALLCGVVRPLADKCARRFHVDPDDLAQETVTSLLTTINGFDPEEWVRAGAGGRLEYPDKKMLAAYAGPAVFYAAIKVKKDARGGGVTKVPKKKEPALAPTEPNPAAWNLLPSREALFGSLVASTTDTLSSAEIEEAMRLFAALTAAIRLANEPMHADRIKVLLEVYNDATVPNKQKVPEAARRLGIKPDTLRHWLYELRRFHPKGSNGPGTPDE